MPPLLSEEEIDAMYSGHESEDEPVYLDMLEDIRDGSKSHTNFNGREARLKMRDIIKKRKSEWKGALKATQKRVKVYTKCLRLL